MLYECSWFWQSPQRICLGWSQGATMNCWAQQCQRVPLWMLQPMAPRRNNDDLDFCEVDWGEVVRDIKVTQWCQVAFRIALPETNIAIENRPPREKNNFWQPLIFRGELLASGRVYTGFTLKNFAPCTTSCTQVMQWSTSCYQDKQVFLGPGFISTCTT